MSRRILKGSCNQKYITFNLRGEAMQCLIKFSSFLPHIWPVGIMKFHNIFTESKDCFWLVLFSSWLTKCQLGSGRNLIELCWVLQWLTSLLLSCGRKHYITCDMCHPKDEAVELKAQWNMCSWISSLQMKPGQHSPCINQLKENKVVMASRLTHPDLSTETTDC